ncbi:Glycerol kinase [Camellia lanceoleosa]|uniref:Glycerol kinase n=1 Tax=Camellia lanceoleosa TaxID=1840588 RepID=A0ACC0FF79_9ERIC|nr:Glycerol kinase [Camellia lanceoleosa]
MVFMKYFRIHISYIRHAVFLIYGEAFDFLCASDQMILFLSRFSLIRRDNLFYQLWTNDSMAIFMAFQSPQLEVLGLTTIFGNITTENATRNASRLCKIAGCPGLPVAEGTPEPLKMNLETRVEFNTSVARGLIEEAKCVNADFLVVGYSRNRISCEITRYCFEHAPEGCSVVSVVKSQGTVLTMPLKRISSFLRSSFDFNARKGNDVLSNNEKQQPLLSSGNLLLSFSSIVDGVFELERGSSASSFSSQSLSSSFNASAAAHYGSVPMNSDVMGLQLVCWLQTEVAASELGIWLRILLSCGCCYDTSCAVIIAGDLFLLTIVVEPGLLRDALFGTTDSWLIWNLTGGVNNGLHVTDVSNASRTMLMDLKTLDWDKSTLEALKFLLKFYPKLSVTLRLSETYQLDGQSQESQLLDVSVINTQQCWGKLVGKERQKMLRQTMLLRAQLPLQDVQWLRDGLGLIKTASEIEDLAMQVKDVLDSMHKDAAQKGEVKNEKGEFLLRVDGGATVNNLLMQIQADLLGSPVVRPADIETQALGAAYAAGLAIGVWTEDEIFSSGEKKEKATIFSPTLQEDLRHKKVKSWCKAVSRSFDLADLSL